MVREHHYRLRTIWTGASQGPTSSYQSYAREYTVEFDGKLSLRCSADPQFRGDEACHNPEDLLVAALSGCHLLSFLAEAARAGVLVHSYEDRAVGTMSFEGGGGHFTRVVLHPRVTVSIGTDVSLLGRLHDQAHANCFIARSVNFPVEHEATVQFREEA